MYQLTDADLVWIRACGEHPLRDLPGDCALTSLLIAHGLTMNGGLLHAAECLTGEEITAAESGYRYFGFGEAASLLHHARTLLSTDRNLETIERQLDDQYSNMIPSDNTLATRFERDLLLNPSNYAPLRAVDRIV